MDEQKYKIHDTDSKMLLKPILKEACRKHQVPETIHEKLIADGVKLFSIFSDGSVIPTRGYQSVDQYVEQHRHDVLPEGSPVKSTKEQLLQEMGRHARAGNMSAYRECRKQYSECS